MRIPNSLIRHLATLALLALAPLAAGQEDGVEVGQTPLLVGTGVAPNVMLLMDNSGSMNNLITHPDYDQGRDYSGPFDRGVYGPYSENRVYGINRYGSLRYLHIPLPLGGETRYSANYLNFLHDRFGDGADLRDGRIPDETRIEVSREVAREIVEDNPGLNFGVMRLANAAEKYDGGRVMAQCGAPQSEVFSAIESLDGETNTPLAEAFYEMTRYFRGKPGFLDYHRRGQRPRYESPVEYRCQESFAVVITDGYPTYDTKFPSRSEDSHTLRHTDRTLPDFDEKSPPTGYSDFPNDVPAYSDGFQPQGNRSMEGYTLYLDDLAAFGADLDLRRGGTDASGRSFDAEDFKKQGLTTFTVGFTVDNQMLEDAAEAGGGEYYTADNRDQLTDRLQTAVDEIIERTSSAASVASNSARLRQGSRIFQSRYNTTRWSGDLVAYPIGADGEPGERVWSAESELPRPGQRELFHRGLGGAVSEFDAAAMDSATRALFDSIEQIDYLRGERANEITAGGEFRSRSGALGDFVNSDPVFSHAENFGYARLEEGADGHYVDHLDALESRSPMLYIGGNDGFLHAFDAESGEERFAFAPQDVLERLPALSDPDYGHRFSVDGTPAVGDVYTDGTWRRVLVGTLGRGGRSVFALDVSEPDDFGADDALWRFTHPELGEAVQRAQIVRLSDGRWAAVFGNGYNSDSGRAGLFVVDIADGSLIRYIDTGVGEGGNGLGTAMAIDADGDLSAEVVYAGDMEGNLWAFDISSTDVSDWRIAPAGNLAGGGDGGSGESPGNGGGNGGGNAKAGGQGKGGNKGGGASGGGGGGSEPAGTPLFVAERNGTRQPITARPEVVRHPDGGVVVLVGTGRFLGTGDVTRTDTQSFYGIRDNGEAVSRSALVDQSVSATRSEGDGLYRVTTRASDDGEAPDGWYIDLPVAGERVVSRARVRDDRVIFTTLIPREDPCLFGGESWLMELQAVSGDAPSSPVFDLNSDQRINDMDRVGGGDEPEIPSGLKSDVGAADSPGIVGEGNIEYKYLSGSSGEIGTVGERGRDPGGRLSWEQIYPR